MRRLGGSVAVWSVACALLQGQGVPIAILQSREGGFYTDAVQRFRQELERQGILAQLETFVLRGDRGDADLPRRVLERKPKVVLAVGTDAAQLLRAYYEKLPPPEQVPVVFTMVLDPVRLGLIESAERSGRRFAGVALTVHPQRQLRALLDAAPTTKRVGVVYNPKEPVFQQLVMQGREDAAKLGLTLEEAHAEAPAQLSAALQQLSGKVDALWLIPDPVCAAPEPFQQIVEWAAAQKVVVLAFAETFVRRGALLGLGVDMAEQGALAAEQVIRILNGEQPEALPLLTPRRLLSYYNLQTARAIGITIPEMLLNLAAKVYE